MEYLIGAALAVGVAAFGVLSGFERDRAFYPTVLVVVAHYYDLFALVGGQSALGAETIGFVLFVGLSVLGFRTNLWIVAFALAGHGVFDLVHGHIITNSGIPTWWPMFCLSYDVAAGLHLAWRLHTKKITATAGLSLAAPSR